MLQWSSLCNIYQMNTPYTLNLHKVVRQLYLNEAGGKWEEERSAVRSVDKGNIVSVTL